MEAILLLIRLFLAGVFAVAGIAKLADPKGSEKAVGGFGVPAAFAKPLSVGLPIVELAAALLLLPVATSWAGSIAAFLILLVFIAGMIYQMAKGKAPECHCFGQLHSEPVSKKSLIRNVVFAALALILAVQGPDDQGLSLVDDDVNKLQLIFEIATVGLLAAAILYLKQVSGQQAEILRRLGVLDLAAGIDEPVKRNEAGDPNDGLPIGAPLPGFAIPDLNGKMVRLEDFVADDKPLLFFFVSPTCDPCEALLPEIEEWEAELGDRLSIVFVSSGERDENVKKFGSKPGRVFLIEPEREFAGLVNARWTPTALFVNSDGNVASHIAAGDTAIRRLLEKIRLADLSRDFVYFLGLNGHGKPKIGQTIPEFSVTDLRGNLITDEHFRGRKTLVTFSSPSCGHCTELMKEIRDWEQQKHAGDPNLVIFSEGEPLEHEKYGVASPVIIEKDFETAKKLGMFGVPSAVLVNEDGKIVTEAAIGGPNIWALIGRRKN
jgi:thiol-disulfide isomerase/thioredoxin/uncharacterized membrane protein YphA (DoxX/SURF4 family)